MSDNVGLEELSEKLDPFVVLPEDSLSEILASLPTLDVTRFLQAIPSIRGRASVIAAAQKALLNEGLPGDSVADLILHFSSWQSYQILLKKYLCELAPGASPDDIESQANGKACRTFLRSAIHLYTLRVARSHSWYKHLPIGLDEKFLFFLHLTVNMNHIEGKFVKAEEGDRGIHYTWLPTDSYRAKYGFFDYVILPNPRQVGYDLSGDDTRPCQMAHGFDGQQYSIPYSMCGPAVDVTAAIHSQSVHHNFYQNVINEAVRQQKPEIVNGDLQPPMFHSLQHRFKDCTGLRLPSKVAVELEEIAANSLSEEGPPDTRLSVSRVLEAQQIRERKAVALSLRELCMRNFGADWTPSVDEVVSFLPE